MSIFEMIIKVLILVAIVAQCTSMKIDNGLSESEQRTFRENQLANNPLTSSEPRQLAMFSDLPTFFWTLVARLWQMHQRTAAAPVLIRAAIWQRRQRRRLSEIQRRQNNSTSVSVSDYWAVKNVTDVAEYVAIKNKLRRRRQEDGFDVASKVSRVGEADDGGGENQGNGLLRQDGKLRRAVDRFRKRQDGEDARREFSVPLTRRIKN